MIERQPSAGRRVLTTDELRAMKPDRKTFRSRPRRPVTVVLDRLSRNFNIALSFACATPSWSVA
jgi:hypothetical protein